MAYQDQFYTVGTAKVTNGSPAVTGTATGWATALIKGGVFYAGGAAYPILSVESETALTLAIPYIGATATDLVYAIDRQRSQATSNVAMNDRLAQIIREISLGNIEQLNGLDLVPNQLLQSDENGALNLLSLVAGKMLYTDADAKLTLSDIKSAAIALLNLTGTAAADRLPYLTGANGAGLTVLTAFARSILDDVSGGAMWATMGGQLNNTVSSGYQKRPDGTIRVWGQSSGGDLTTPFLTAMPNAVFSHGASAINANTANTEILSIEASVVTTTGITWRPRYSTGGGVGVATQAFKWWAEGY